MNSANKIFKSFLPIYLLLFITYDLTFRIASSLKIKITYFNHFFSEIISFFFKDTYSCIDRSTANIEDTLCHYITLLLLVVVAISIAFLLNLKVNKRQEDNTANYWFLLAFRYYLGIILINYGLVKLFWLQFPEPNLMRLIKTYGESSPMGLAWTFFGYSKGYNVFMGIAELMSVFLFFRRTLTFGLIVNFVVVLNVMAINFFYDVPLKIVTTHLLLITIYMLSYDFRKLVVLFFFNRPVTLNILKRPDVFNRLKISRVSRVFKIVALAAIFVVAFFKLNKRNAILNGDFSKSKFYGIYDVVSVMKNGNITNNNDSILNWRYLIMEYQGWTQILDTYKQEFLYNTKIDTVAKTIELFDFKDKKDDIKIEYEFPQDQENHIILYSEFNGDSVEIKCRILKESDFFLMNRNFNLINEIPENR